MFIESLLAIELSWAKQLAAARTDVFQFVVGKPAM
jgi:hypothetical protein